MSLPRRSVAGLATQAQLEPKILLGVVEGISDREALGNWAKDAGVPVALYAICDIEVGLLECFKEFGGEKGRILSLFVDDGVRPYADRNTVGIVDRDLDYALGRVVEIPGVYYTEWSSLFCSIFTMEGTKEFINRVFHRQLNDEVVEELFDFSRKYFCLLVARHQIDKSATLPGIASCIRSAKQGGFDWDKYFILAAQKFGRDFSAQNLREVVDQIELVGDPRSNMHLHTFVEYMLLLLKKEKVLSNRVRREEMYRHIEIFYTLKIEQCGVSALISTMAASL